MTEAKTTEAREREALVDTLAGELRERWPESCLSRILAGLEIWCYRECAQPYPRQQAYGFYLPGLPDKPWIDPDTISFTRQLKDKYPVIRDEALQLIDGSLRAPPYGVADDAPADTPTTPGRPEGWLEWRIATRGRLIDQRCERFPKTTQLVRELLDSTPYLMNAIFMVLKPGSELKPHADFNNTFVNVWLGIESPPNCALEVAGIAQTPVGGSVLAFNHSYEHVSWNRDVRDRIVFSISTLHPDLDSDEQAAAALIIPRLESHVTKYASLR
jgi:aspartate beta-hydroxylase